MRITAHVTEEQSMGRRDTGSMMANGSTVSLSGRRSGLPKESPAIRSDHPDPQVWMSVLAASLVALGLFARVWPRSALWLDEAQTVSFARMPLATIPRALRQDGSPPLFYLVLHVWAATFGTSDDALRSLSVVCSAVSLPVLFIAARRLIGSSAARVATVMMATSPFAIRYASETRMYSMVMLEVTLGLAGLLAALAAPSRARLIGVAAITTALLYTHYWAIYLVAATGALLVWIAVRGVLPSTRVAGRRTLAAVVGGALVWIPWVPTFLFQLRHTGTPWSQAGHAARERGEGTVPTRNRLDPKSSWACA
jgi:mannosyltransferase